MKKPNVLFLLVDTLRSDLSVSPELRKRLPHIHFLKEHGFTFSTVIAVNSSTPACISSLFTGLYPVHHGVRMLGVNRLPSWCSTMAELFKSSGYHTYASVAGPLEPAIGFDRGFDSFHMRKERTEHVYSDWFGEFLKMLRTGYREPWFAYIHFWEVHQPRMVLPQFNTPQYGKSLYERAITSWDSRLEQVIRAAPPDTLIILTGDHGERIEQNQLEGLIDRFKSPLRHALKSMGVREKHLKSIGRARALMLHFLFKRGLVKDPMATLVGHGHHVYDYLVKVPLVLFHKTLVPNGVEYDRQVSQVDILPTLVDILGLDAPKGPLDGQSLLPVMKGGQVQERPAYVEAGALSVKYGKDMGNVRLGGVRHHGWKYVCSLHDPNAPEELYNLSSDPAEKSNLALDESSKERKEQLSLMVKSHFRQADERPKDDLSQELSGEELRQIEARLRDLGYME